MRSRKKLYSHDEILEDVDKILLGVTQKVIDDILKDSQLRGSLLIHKLKLLKVFMESGQYIHVRRINRPPKIGVKERPDIELFGGHIIVEVETTEDTIEEGRKQLCKYIGKYYRNIARLGIVTTGLCWEIYHCQDGVLKKRIGPYYGNESLYMEGSIVEAVLNSNLPKVLYSMVKKILLEWTLAYKYPPIPENIFTVFYPVLANVSILEDLMDRYGIHERAMYQSYREIMLRIYGGLCEDELIRLFATHTLLQMIVNTITAGAFGRLDEPVEDPLKVCSGELLEYDISVPHLMWWRELIKECKEAEVILRDVCNDIYDRALLFDWSSEIIEDVFSHLYEDFIDRELRYRIGEYYTPWWLIEFMVRHLKESFNVEMREKLILDPACGSGRFLVRTFYEKVRNEREIPQKAYYEVLGLDINPLAVSVARAELMIAYKRVSGKVPQGTPLIFWGDFLSSEIGLEVELVHELREIITRIATYSWQVEELSRLKRHEMVLFLARFEFLLAEVIKSFMRGEHASEILKRMKRHKPLDDVDMAARTIITRIPDDDVLISKIMRLVRKYGDVIWAIPITSYLFVRSMRQIKPDIILTNPPWLKLSELPQSKWGEKVRKYIGKKIIERYRKEIPGLSKVGMAGDISALFLKIILDLINEPGYVGIVLPAEQSYSPTPHGVGKLLTYAVVKEYRVKGNAIYIGDAFKHGREASVLVIAKEG